MAEIIGNEQALRRMSAYTGANIVAKNIVGFALKSPDGINWPLFFCARGFAARLHVCKQENESMKRLPSIAVMVSIMLVAACSSPQNRNAAASASANQGEMAAKAVRTGSSANRITIRDASGSVVVQKVGFRPGVSSATVERLAKRFSCTGGAGAGLITEKGPVEVYRMQCDNGATFLAQCELRQCRPMHAR